MAENSTYTSPNGILADARKMVFNNLTETPGSFRQDSSTSGLVRLVEDPDITKKIRFDSIEINAEGKTVYDGFGNGTPESEAGLYHPIIRINDMIIDNKNIMSMIISLEGFTPAIQLSLIYEDTTFESKNPPKDGDMISLFIRTDTNAIQYLRDDFIITSCVAQHGSYSNTESSITLMGKLFIPGFDSKCNTKGYTGSSKLVMKKIAQDYGIGFAFNDFDDTNDFQTWIQCKETVPSFVRNVAAHAWKDNTSFFGTWIDLYYNLCFVNVNKFMLSTENKEELDVTFATRIVHMFNQLRVDSSVGNALGIPKVLSNIGDFSTTPFYIAKWQPYNNSTNVSMSYGYSAITRSFLHNQNLIAADSNRCFKTLTNIPAYDPKKTDSMILLRGRATYDSQKNPEAEQPRVNHDFVNTYIRDEWAGVEYVMADDDDRKDPMQWSGNTHKNYRNAPFHNAQNFSELKKIYLEVTCPGLCLQIMKGERIPVILTKANTIEAEKMNNFSENDIKTNINMFYSGYYYVDSVRYNYGPRGKELSPYTTTFILKRREWPTPEAL